MAVVYSEHRIFPDAQAKIAELELTLAMARPFIESRVQEFGPSRVCQDMLARIDKALDGSIHSFTPNGEQR
jgi:hypothetical protein